MSHYYYKVLDKYLYGTAARTVVKKMLIDTLLFVPTALISFYFVHGLLSGHSAKYTAQDLKQTGLRMWSLDLVFWIPIQIINFRYVSPKYRVTVVNVAAFCFDVLFTYFYHVRDKWHKVKLVDN